MSNTNNRIKILQALTAENSLPVPLSDDNVIVSDPVMYVGNADGIYWNTMATVTGRHKSIYTGSVNIYYNRISLERFSTPEGLLQEKPFTPQDIINALNRMHDDDLGLDDLAAINTANFPMQAGVIRYVDLYASPTSLRNYGSIRIPIAIGIPDEASRLHILIHQTMPANNYW